VVDLAGPPREASDVEESRPGRDVQRPPVHRGGRGERARAPGKLEDRPSERQASAPAHVGGDELHEVGTWYAAAVRGVPVDHPGQPPAVDEQVAGPQVAVALHRRDAVEPRPQAVGDPP